MKKYTLLALTAILFAITLSAQDLTTYKRYLSAPVQVDSLTRVDATVRVVEHEIPAASPSATPTAISGHRIMIFMSNSASARPDALAAHDLFVSLFPDQCSYITYENPYFKVTVGNYTSQEEALIQLERIKTSFPKAFIVRETIALEELTR